jgi:hypothetical protein
MMQSSDYRRAYEAAKQESADLIEKRKETEQRLLVLRKSIQTLATPCANEGIPIEPSTEAVYFLEHSTLADEIRPILKSAWPDCLRPHLVIWFRAAPASSPREFDLSMR